MGKRDTNTRLFSRASLSPDAARRRRRRTRKSLQTTVNTTDFEYLNFHMMKQRFTNSRGSNLQRLMFKWCHFWRGKVSDGGAHRCRSNRSPIEFYVRFGFCFKLQSLIFACLIRVWCVCVFFGWVAGGGGLLGLSLDLVGSFFKGV